MDLDMRELVAAPEFIPRNVDGHRRHFRIGGDPAFRMIYQPDFVSERFGPIAYEVRGDAIRQIPLFRPPAGLLLNEPPSDAPNFQSYGTTANQIKFRRRFYYAQRERPNALAVIHPETKEVLLPGKAKITKEEEEFQRQTELEADQLNQLYYEKQKLLRDIANLDRNDTSADSDNFEEEEEPRRDEGPPLCPYHDFKPTFCG